MLLTLRDGEAERLALDGVVVRTIGVPLNRAKCDLSLALAATGRGLTGGLTYSTGLFDEGSVARIVDRLRLLLEQVASAATVRLAELAPLDVAEYQRVITDWNRTERPFPHEATIAGRFAEQVAVHAADAHGARIALPKTAKRRPPRESGVPDRDSGRGISRGGAAR